MMIEDTMSSSCDKNSATMNTNFSTEIPGSVADLKRKIKDEPIDEDTPCKYARYDLPASDGANSSSVSISADRTALLNKFDNSERGFTKDTAGAIANDGVLTIQPGNTASIKSVSGVLTGDVHEGNSLSSGIMYDARLPGVTNNSVIQLGNNQSGNNLSEMTISNTIGPRHGAVPVTRYAKPLGATSTSVSSASNGLYAKGISNAHFKDVAKASATPSRTGRPKGRLKLHRCRICLKIFASADFLSKHIAQKHAEELNKRTLKVTQDVNKTMNKTSEHGFVRSEHQIDNSEHQLRVPEYQFQSYEHNLHSEHQVGNTEHQPRSNEHQLRNAENQVGNTEHQLGNTEHQVGNAEHQLWNNVHGNSEHDLEKAEHQIGNTKYHFGNIEHRFKDKFMDFRRELENQNLEETRMVFAEQTSLVEEEEFGKKDEQQLKKEEEQLKKEREQLKKKDQRWKAGEDGLQMTEEQMRICEVKALKEGEWIKKEKEEEEEEEEEERDVDVLRLRAWRQGYDSNGMHWVCVCGLRFKEESHRERHQVDCPTHTMNMIKGKKTYGGSTEGMFWCICGLRFKRSSHLKQHQNAYGRCTVKQQGKSIDGVHFWCVCGVFFKYRCHLERHQTTCHKHIIKGQGDSTDGTVLWCICGSRFKTQNDLQEHENACGKCFFRDKGYSMAGMDLWCICGFRFRGKSRLEGHQTTCGKYTSQDQGGSTEGDQESCSCEKCGFNFKTRDDLFVHQQMKSVCALYRRLKKEESSSIVSMPVNHSGSDDFPSKSAPNASLPIKYLPSKSLSSLPSKVINNVPSKALLRNSICKSTSSKQMPDSSSPCRNRPLQTNTSMKDWLRQSIAYHINPEHRNPVVVLNDCMKGMKGKQKTTFCIVNKKPAPTKEETYPCPNCHKRFRAVKFLLLHQTNRRCYLGPVQLPSATNQKLPGPSGGTVPAIPDSIKYTFQGSSAGIVPASPKQVSGRSILAIPGSSQHTLPGTVKQMIPGFIKEEAPGQALPGCKGESLEHPGTTESQDRSVETKVQQTDVGKEIKMAADVKIENEVESDGEAAKSEKDLPVTMEIQDWRNEKEVDQTDVGKEIKMAADAKIENEVESDGEAAKSEKDLPVTMEIKDKRNEKEVDQTDVGKDIKMAADVKIENEVELDGDAVSEKPGLQVKAYEMSSSECYKCSLCDKKFESESMLRQHTMYRHCSFFCDFCRRAFSSSEALEKHKQYSKHYRVFICLVGICNKRFKEQRLLDNHMKITHPCRAKDFYTCDICKIDFMKKNIRDEHMAQHYGKVHTCDICDRGFLKPENLERHFKIHAFDGLRKCRFCEVRFDHNEDLKGHTKTCHGLHGESHAYLKDHVRITAANNPYTCNLCHRSYGWLPNLIAHFLDHQS